MDSDTPIEGDDGYDMDIANQWYLLYTGHPVPRTFLPCTVFPIMESSALGRTGPPERPRAEHLSAYLQLLDVSAPFVEQVVVLTQRIFGAAERAHGRRRVDLDGGQPLPAPPSGWLEQARRAWRRSLRRRHARAGDWLQILRVVLALLFLVFCAVYVFMVSVIYTPTTHPHAAPTCLDRTRYT